MGKPISNVYQISNIKEITIFNRIGSIDFKVDDFTIEQLKNYNVKQHKQLYKQFEQDKFNIRNYKNLLLKLLLLVGFNNANVILNIDNSLLTLEHLIGTVDVSNIKLDSQGNPILNTRIINLLFNEKNHSKIKSMLTDKDNNLYSYFPRLFNEWKIIPIDIKNKSLKVILDFLKSKEIKLPPNYYRLKNAFKYIGCNDKFVKETISLHDQMLKRTSSTIPRIVGTKGNYSYEILKLNDMEGLFVGNKTDCCFTVLGNSYSSLKHALTSDNGRILVIRKDNELLAHSWIWRNGNLLCLDNIEISKKIKQVDFLDVYLQIADEIIKKSFHDEGIDNSIKNITIGFPSFNKPINGIEEYPCIISRDSLLKSVEYEEKLGINRIFVERLPQPLEKVEYSDSKSVQYLIRGNSNFDLKCCSYSYHDERNENMHYDSNLIYNEEYLSMIYKKINALRYIKMEQDNELEEFKMIYIKDLDSVYCNDDWYILIDKNGTEESFINSSDEDASLEFNSIREKEPKRLCLKRDNCCS